MSIPVNLPLSSDTILAPCPSCGIDHSLYLTSGGPEFQKLQDKINEELGPRTIIQQNYFRVGDFLSESIPDGEYCTEKSCCRCDSDSFNGNSFQIKIEEGYFQGFTRKNKD